MSLDTQDKLNAAEKDYQDKFNDITSRPDMRALNDQGDAAIRDHERNSIDKSRQAISGAEDEKGKAEKQAIGDTKTGQAAIAAASVAGSPIAGRMARLLGKVRVNKTTGGVVAAVGIVVIMIFGASFLTTSLGPIAFFTNILDDLNDQLPAMDNRMGKLMQTKVMTSAERDQFIKGCTKMSIRCKYKSLSTKDVERFNRAGIEVEGSKVAGRTFPTKYWMEMDGTRTEFSPAKLAAEVNTRGTSIAKDRVRTALNMRSHGFVDKVSSYVIKKVGGSRAAPKMTGDVEEDKTLLAQGRASLSADTSVNIGRDENGNPTVNGETTSGAGADATTVIADGAASGFSKGVTQFAKVFNITGYYDMACTLKNMIGYSAAAAKYAKGVKLAAYVLPFAALAYKIKAGDATPHDAEVLGELMNSPDLRKDVTDLNATMATYDTGSQQVTEKTVSNPYYGKNVLDGSLHEMSALGAPPITSQATEKYSLGVTLLSLVGALSFSAALMSAMGVSKTGCQIVQNWAARGGAFVVGILAWLTGVGEAVTASNIAFAAAITAAFIVVGISLAVITNQNPVPEDIAQKPEEMHAAFWSGEAFLSGEMPKTRGLVPGTESEIIAYSKSLKSSNLAYDAIESADTAWYDTSSPHSLLSKIATTLNTSAQPSLSLSSTIASAGALTQRASTSIFYSPAYAASIDPARLKKCVPDAEIDGYAKAYDGARPIAVDVQCNVRYHMPPEDLELDADEVAKYMEDNGYVAKDTETGLPEGYTLPPEDTTQNFAAAFLKGTVTSFIDQFYSTRNYGSEYGKFLDFCAYRSMPWGETFEESSGVKSAGADWVNGTNCMKKGMPYSAFRIYTLDKSVNEASEPGPVDGGTVSTGDIAGGGTITGDVKNLAQQILDLAKAGKITLAVLRQEDIATRTTPQLQLEDIAAGKIPNSPSRARVDGEFTPPSPIIPDPKILAFLVDLGGKYKYTITSLFGQKHSETSGHYEGKAVDFGCPFNTTVPDAVGKKYTVGRNWENCPDHKHYHYEVGLAK